MRSIERIDPFLKKIGKLWKEQCPDWRFGQLMSNVLNSFDRDPFFIEEDEMIKKFKEYFGVKDD